MQEGKFECSICGCEEHGMGNNPEPFPGERCCKDCDDRFVIPVRMVLGRGYDNANTLSFLQTIAELGKAIRRVNVESMQNVVKLHENRTGDRSEPA